MDLTLEEICRNYIKSVDEYFDRELIICNKKILSLYGKFVKCSKRGDGEMYVELQNEISELIKKYGQTQFSDGFKLALNLALKGLKIIRALRWKGKSLVKSLALSGFFIVI